MREDDSVAVRILGRLGVTRDDVRKAVEKEAKPRDGSLGSDMQLAPQAKRVIDIAYDQAQELDNNYIGTEHLLAGLAGQPEELAGKVLTQMGVSLDAILQEIRELQRNASTDGSHKTDADAEALAPKRRVHRFSGKLFRFWFAVQWGLR